MSNPNSPMHATTDDDEAEVTKDNSGGGTGPRPREKKRPISWLRILASCAFLGGLSQTIDLHAAWGIAREASPLWLLLAIAVAFGGRLFAAFRWYLLVHGRSAGVSYWRMVRLVLVSTMLGMFLPGGIAPEAIRVYGLARSTADLSLALASVLVERMLAMLALVLLALAGLLYSPTGLPESLTHTAWAGLFCLLAGATAILLPAVRSLGGRILHLLRLGFIQSRLDSLYAALDVYKSQPHIITMSILSAFISVAFRIVPTVVMAEALGLDIPLVYFAIFLPIVHFIVQIPISFGGLGVRETAFVWLFGLVGVPEAEAFTLSLGVFAITLLSTLPGAWLFARGGVAPAPLEDQSSENGRTGSTRD